MAINGKNAVVKIGTAASETDISQYCDSVGFPQDVEEYDTTTFGTTTNKTFDPGNSETTVDFSGNWDATIDGILAPLFKVAGKSIVYGPAGSTTGLPKRSALGFLKKYNIKSPASGKVTFDASFRVNGPVTIGVF